MRPYLSTYKIVLETKAPLYIGSGKLMGKKEYIYNRAEKEVFVPDIMKMYRGLSKKGLGRAYEKFLLDSRETDLYLWLKNHNVSVKEYKEWENYSYDSTDIVFDKRTRDVSLFVKDPYGNPYIPGSSLKGALRTIFCVNEILYDERTKRQTQNLIEKQLRGSKPGRGYLQKEINNIESNIFHNLDIKDIPKYNAVQDNMKGVIISDSRSLKVTDLTLCQKIDVDTRGRRTRMPILRECIKPGTKIEFDLTIDDSINGYYDESILEAVNNFLEGYYQFLDKYENTEREKDIIYLGGSVGFASKTILYGLFPEREAVKVISTIFDKTLPKPIKQQHHHERDLRLGVSPHIKKCTEYAGKEYEFGKCKITIEET